MSRRWILRKALLRKLQGQVWIVRNRQGRPGYFKYATPEQWYYSGPLIANEFIAAALARRVGLPVARLETARVKGPDGVMHHGVVSIPVRAKRRVTWRNVGAAVKNQPETHIHHVNLLRGLVVFDAWIANTDRGTGTNLILYRNRPREKFRWYLIDHANALYGSPFKWEHFGSYRSPLWDDVWRSYHVPRGLLRLQSTPYALNPMISKIESLCEQDIDAAIRCAPRGCLDAKERHFIKCLLLYRQLRLRMVMERWLNYTGTKEYGRVVTAPSQHNTE